MMDVTYRPCTGVDAFKRYEIVRNGTVVGIVEQYSQAMSRPIKGIRGVSNRWSSTRWRAAKIETPDQWTSNHTGRIAAVEALLLPPKWR